MQSVLITGANGFVGSHLCDAFLEKGYKVYGLVRESSDLRFLERSRATLVHGDLTDPGRIAFPETVDVIVHAAALTLDNVPLQQSRDHVYGITKTIADEAVRRYPRLSKFIYISSALTLGYCADDISAQHPGRSVQYVPYIRMKKIAEQYLIAMHQETGFPVVILRPGDIYGPRDRTSCELMLHAAEQGVPIRIGRGRNKFGLCSPTNLCRAALAAIERPATNGKAYTVVNGIAPTWKEFFDALQSGVGKPQKLYIPVSLLMCAAILMELVRLISPTSKPPINFYRIRRITSQTTYDMRATFDDLGYDSDDDYQRLFASIVEWYRREKARSSEPLG
jgi:nucleoside-diphosphate-sugar epimerase